MERTNVWLLVMVFGLLSLAIANAIINVQNESWADLAFSLCMMCLFIPLPENLKFLHAKINQDFYRSKTVSVIHSISAFAFMVGLVGKVI
jgi:hypothetical protein